MKLIVIGVKVVTVAFILGWFTTLMSTQHGATLANRKKSSVSVWTGTVKVIETDCPSGFTKITSQSRVLGCIQITEEMTRVVIEDGVK